MKTNQSFTRRARQLPQELADQAVFSRAGFSLDQKEIAFSFVNPLEVMEKEPHLRWPWKERGIDHRITGRLAHAAANFLKEARLVPASFLKRAIAARRLALELEDPIGRIASGFGSRRVFLG